MPKKRRRGGIDFGIPDDAISFGGEIREVLPEVEEHDPVLWVGDQPIVVLTDRLVAYRIRGRGWHVH